MVVELITAVICQNLRIFSLLGGSTISAKGSADNSSGFALSMQLCRSQSVDGSPNIIIIGAGLIGLCTAEARSSRGANVTVIDARPGPCEGTSFSNSGMIHPSQALSWEMSKPSVSDLDAARVTAALAKRSRDLLMDMIRRLGLPARQGGCLQIFRDFSTARLAQKTYDEIGISSNILIDPIDSFGRPACQFPHDNSGDARAFGCALEMDLRAHGVRFVYGAVDADFRHTDAGFTVRVSDQILKADHLILAAGIQTAALLSKFEIRMQLKAVSGAAADFALPNVTEDLPSYPVMDTESRSAMTVFQDRVRISGGWGVEDPALLVKHWRDIAPALMMRLGSPRSTWTGVRPVSPVGRPYISGTSIPNLWVNTGHGHMGWTLCVNFNRPKGQSICLFGLEG